MATAVADIQIEEGKLDAEFLRAIADVLQVPERMPLSEWAESYRILPQEEAKGGLYRLYNTPWNAEIMNRLDPDDPCTEVVYMKSTQIGATELGNNWLGQVIHQLGGRFLSVFPTSESAKRNMRTRIAPMIASTPEIKAKVAKPNSREGANTLLEKEWDGGVFVCTGANSGVGLRSLASPRIVGDEIEAFVPDVDHEGDPIELVKRRADSYGGDKKFLWMSTPKEEDTSRIEPLYKASDRNKFYVPCLECGAEQALFWSQIGWDPMNPLDAWYNCRHCERKWTQGMKIQATREGRWIADREWQVGMPRGYFINAIYSHTVELSELVAEWIISQTHIEKFITFVNTRLGETWKDQSIYSHDTDSLLARREEYEWDCPEGVQLITAGVDVQQDRLELEVLGWGWEEECWSLGHHVFYGDTSTWAPWNEMDLQLAKAYRGPTSDQYISAVAVDSGDQTNMVYNYCLRRDSNRTARVWPVKGAKDNYGPLWGKKPIRNSIKKLTPYMINTHEIKKSFYARLGMQPGGPGTFHFSTRDYHDAEYVEQLTSETLRTKRVAGRSFKKWEVRNGKRNEVIDCVVYAFAAMKGMCKSGFRFAMPAPKPEEIEAQEVVAPSSGASAQESCPPVSSERFPKPSPMTPAQSHEAVPPSAQEHAAPPQSTSPRRRTGRRSNRFQLRR